MNSLKRVQEDLEESKQHGGHVVRSHRKPPTGNVRKAVIATAIVTAAFVTLAPVAGTPVIREAVAAPVIDSEGVILVDPDLTTAYEIDRLKEAIARSRRQDLITIAPIVTVAVIKPTWVHPLASGKQGNSCYRTRNRPSHGGVDMAQPYGTPIRAVAAGTIYRRAFESGGAGYYVTVRHAGNIFSQYHHLNARAPLSVGTPVQAGQIIGYVGATGNATGNHLHFEIRTGSVSHRVNPASFMRSRGISIGC
jgi:hypothetical protein